MIRYPDTIIILEAVGGDPYHEPTWKQVYTGRCRCFLHRESGFRTNKVMDCSHQVVIPDRNMPEIGENFKVGVKMHTNKNNRNWDLVGYVKDFARYDRVCNLNFQMVKENLIYEDIPAPAIDMDERNLMNFEDGWFYLESIGLIGGEGTSEEDAIMLFEDELASLEMKIPVEDREEGPVFNSTKFFSRNSNGEWVEDAMLPVRFIQKYTEGYFDENTGDMVYRRGGSMSSDMYAFYPSYVRSDQEEPPISDKERNVIRVDVVRKDYEQEILHQLYIQIMKKG